MKKRDFEGFYKENVDRIYRYVFFRVGKRHEVSEDLVSEIFMKALRNFEKYDPKISKSAWIYRIAQNHLANHFRDQKAHVDIEDVSFGLVGVDGEEVMIQIETALRTNEVLAGLDPDERRLVTMKHLEGYSYTQMADILGKTADALKVATYRAMGKLKGEAGRWKLGDGDSNNV